MKTCLHFNPLPFLSRRQAWVPVFFKSLVTLFLFGILLFSSKTFGQAINPGTAPVNPPSGGFAIDGSLNANSSIGDWLDGSGAGGFVLDNSGNPLGSTTFHLIDRYTSPDNNFKGGFKVNNDPNDWLWVTNPVNDKEDINNALIHFTHSLDGHLWVIIAADRKSNNGDAYIDFEFLQNTLSITGGPAGGGFTSSGPDGGRTLNDFLLTLELTNGGSSANFFVDRWQAVGSGFDYVDRTDDVPAGSVLGDVNDADGTPVSFGAFGKTTYDKNTFVEAAVDLTALLGAIESCTELGIKTIMIKTKESQAPTATIVDFIAPLQGSITIGVADAGPDQTKCADASGITPFSLTGTATPSPGDAVDHVLWTVVSGSATIDPPTADQLNVTGNVTSSTATLRFTVTTTGGCVLSDDVVLNVTGAPDNTFELFATNYCAGDPALGTVNLSGSESGVSCQLVDLNDQPVDDPKVGTGSGLTWTGIGPGTYHVVYTANGGCTSTGNNPATVVENQPPTTEPGVVNPSRCGEGQLTLTADCTDQNGTTPTWYDAATLGNLLFTGSSYDVTITGTKSFWVSCTSAEGCEGPRAEVVATVNTIPDPPTVDAGNITECAQDPVQTLTASATIKNATLVWYTTAAGNTTIDPPSLDHVGTVTYYAAAVSDNGCYNTIRTPATLTINETPAAPTVTAVDNCDGTSTLTVAGIADGATVTWSDDATNHDNPRIVNAAGTYKVTQTLGDCSSGEGSADAAPKTKPNTPSVGVVDNCDGTSTLTVTGIADGATITWSDDATNHDNPRIVNAAGTYKVTQTVSECTSDEGSGIAAPKTKPGIPSVGVVDNCDGTSTLTVTGIADGAIITWSDDATNHNNPRIVTVAGTYKITQTVNGCTSAEGSGIAAPKTTPSAPSASGTTTCAPTQAVASATGCTGTLKWYDAATGGNLVATGVSSVSTSTTKTYYVSCTNAGGCESARTAVTATVNICTGIYPTATSCTGFNSGTIQFLPKVCVATKTTKGVTTVSNATPGVFFYYTKITAPAATFSVYIDQTQCSALNRNFAIQKGQMLAFTNGCAKIATGAQASTAGDGVITIKNVHIGDLIVISVKYDVKSMVGATVTGGLPVNCTDNFVARLGTTNAGSIITNTSTSILVTSNCSASALATFSSIAKTSDQQSIQVKTYPNPYTSSIKFQFTSPLSGTATLEAFDLMGKKIAVIYHGKVDAGIERMVTFNVPAGNRVPMMYKLTVDGQSVRGMLLPTR